MGLHIRVYDINCPNPFELSYRIAPTPGNETIISSSTGYTQYGGTYPSSSDRNYYTNPIILTGATFDDRIQHYLGRTGDYAQAFDMAYKEARIKSQYGGQRMADGGYVLASNVFPFIL